MKKILVVMTSFLLLCLLVGCNINGKTTNGLPDSDVTTNENKTTNYSTTKREENPTTKEKEDPTPIEEIETLFGTDIERALKISKKVEDGMVSKADESDKKEKYRKNKPESGMYQIDGLSGYFNFSYRFDDDINKGLSETLLTFNSVMYSILFSGESEFEFDGVTFSSKEDELYSLIRIDSINENAYMITRERGIEIFGIFNGFEFFMTLDIKDNSFSVYATDFRISYTGSTSSYIEEKEMMIAYVKEASDILSPEIFESLYSICIKEGELIDVNDFLKENVNYTIRSKQFKNEYYHELANTFNFKGNDKIDITINEGTLTSISTSNDFFCFEVPEVVERIESFDNYQNYFHKLNAIYIPKTVSYISKESLLTLSTCVIFTEYSYEEMPKEILESLLETMERREIYFKNQYVVDENGRYIPNIYYILNAKTNKNGLEIADILNTITDFHKYESLIKKEDLCKFNDLSSKLYNDIFEASTLEEIESLINAFNDTINNEFKNIGDIELLTYAIDKTVNAKNYYLEAKYKINGDDFEIKATHSYNNVSSYLYTKEQNKIYASATTNYLFDYFGVLYKYNDARNSYEVYDSYETYELENFDVKFLKYVLDVMVSSDNSTYDEERNVYEVLTENDSLEIELTDGFVSKIKGRVDDVIVEYATVSYVNAVNICVSSYIQEKLPNINTKYSAIRNIYYDLGLDGNYEISSKIIRAYDVICSLKTIEEKDAYYEEIIKIVLDIFDFEEFNLYYLDDSGNKIVAEKGTMPENPFAKLKFEIKDLSKYIEKRLRDAFTEDREIVMFNGYAEDGIYYFCSFEPNSKTPFISINLNEKRYAFIPNNNGKYVVIIDDVYIETTESIDEYQEALKYLDIYFMVKNFVMEEHDYINTFDNYYAFKEKGEYLRYSYNGTTYFLSDMYFAPSSSQFEFRFNEGAIYINFTRFDGNWGGHVTDITKFVYEKHAND